MKVRKGDFTLMEVVSALLILLLLCALATPRFIQLQHNARANTMEKLGETLKSVNHSLIAMSINQGVEISKMSTMTVNGRDIQVQFGRLGLAETETKAATDISHLTNIRTRAANGLEKLTGDEFAIMVYQRQRMLVLHPNTSIQDKCYLEYLPAVSPTHDATVQINSFGC